jgi:NAD-dependent deacetylase
MAIVPLAQRPTPYRRIVVLTGAGISASAGLPTYRGPGGLWNRDPELARSLVAGAPPSVVWRALGSFRSDVARAQPTPAHGALAKLEERISRDGGTVTIVTQNIDGLHGRAGSKNLVELHGNLRRTRCSSADCTLEPFEDDTVHEAAPLCAQCGAPLRLDIVLFEEPLGAHEETAAKRALRDCDLFLAIGTSGTVWPAASYVRSAEYEGAHTIFVNLTPLESSSTAFREVLLGAADDVVPTLVA